MSAVEELEDIATQAANDALMAVLRKLDDFRGASRFTTWAYKFALLEAGVRLRRRATRGALYKTLHDARQKLRAELEREGMA